MKNIKKIYFILFIAFIYIILFSGSVFAASTATYTGSNLDTNKYPGYKALLDKIKSDYGYNIQLYYTGVNWEEALTIEYQGHGKSPSNLFYVSETRKGAWYCPLCGEKVYDSSIPCASKEAIAYMLDPRNSLTDESIFQFMNIEGHNNMTKQQLAAMVGGTLLANDDCLNGLIEAGQAYNLNPAFLAAKIIIEQGSNGSRLTQGQGDLSGNYKGYYNYFNYGASGSGSAAIITNGLKMAQAEGWNSPKASIIGGARHLKESYIDTYGQNTFYFLKFNFAGKNTLGSHQYEQNVMGAESKGSILRKYFKKTTGVTPTMVIPLYENMPILPAERPDTNIESSITYEDGEIKNLKSTISIRSSDKGIIFESVPNNTSVKIIKRATAPGDRGYYWDLVLVNKTGTYGYVARNTGNEHLFGSGVYHTIKGKNDVVKAPKELATTTDGYLHVTPSVTIEDVKAKFIGSRVYGPNSKEVTSGSIATSSIVIANDKVYRVAKKGDLNCDGLANQADADMLNKHYTNAAVIKDATILQAARVATLRGGTEDDYKQLLQVVSGSAFIILDPKLTSVLPEETEEEVTDPNIPKQIVLTEDGFLHITPTVTVKDIKAQYKDARVFAIDYREKTSGSIGTRGLAIINGRIYTIVKRGDVNGDCLVNQADADIIYNHYTGKQVMTDNVYIQAGRVSNGTGVTEADYNKIKEYIDGKVHITF